LFDSFVQFIHSLTSTILGLFLLLFLELFLGQSLLLALFLLLFFSICFRVLGSRLHNCKNLRLNEGVLDSILINGELVVIYAVVILDCLGV